VEQKVGDGGGRTYCPLKLRANPIRGGKSRREFVVWYFRKDKTLKRRGDKGKKKVERQNLAPTYP